MTMVDTQFFEKKYRSFFDGTASEFQGQKFPYILFFQMNHVSSKEWIALQKTFHQQSPSTIHHMIPKRFLVRILKPHVFPEKTHSLFSFHKYDQNYGPLQGHSCFFFCQTLDEVHKFFDVNHNQDSYDRISNTSSEFMNRVEPLMLSQTLWTKSQQKRFIPLGLFERKFIENSVHEDFEFFFWNSYDVQKILRLTSHKVSPIQQMITQVLYPTMTLPIHMINQYDHLLKGFQPFVNHHYQLYTLLMILSAKLKTQS